MVFDRNCAKGPNPTMPIFRFLEDETDMVERERERERCGFGSLLDWSDTYEIQTRFCPPIFVVECVLDPNKFGSCFVI
jgi:hypothetical protein